MQRRVECGDVDPGHVHDRGELHYRLVYADKGLWENPKSGASLE
jgi:hypothetical protein